MDNKKIYLPAIIVIVLLLIIIALYIIYEKLHKEANQNKENIQPQTPTTKKNADAKKEQSEKSNETTIKAQEVDANTEQQNDPSNEQSKKFENLQIDTLEIKIIGVALYPNKQALEIQYNNENVNLSDSKNSDLVEFLKLALKIKETDDVIFGHSNNRIYNFDVQKIHSNFNLKEFAGKENKLPNGKALFDGTDEENADLTNYIKNFYKSLTDVKNSSSIQIDNHDALISKQSLLLNNVTHGLTHFEFIHN